MDEEGKPESPGGDVERNRFLVCDGPMTEEERDFLIKVGLMVEMDGQYLEVSTLSESGLEQGLNSMIEDENCEDLDLPIVDSNVVLSKSGIEMPDPDHQEQSQSSEDLPIVDSSVVLSISGIEMPDPDHQEQSQSSEDLPIVDSSVVGGSQGSQGEALNLNDLNTTFDIESGLEQELSVMIEDESCKVLDLPIVDSSMALSKSGIEIPDRPDPDHQEQSQSSEDLPIVESSVVLSISGIEMPDPDHQKQSQSSEDLPIVESSVVLSEIGFEMPLDTVTEDDNKENIVTTPEASKCSKPVVKVETSMRMSTRGSTSSTPANTPVRRSLRNMIRENSYYGTAGSLMFGDIYTGEVSTLSESGLEQGLNAMIEDEGCEDVDLPIVDSSVALSKSGIEVPDPDHQEQSQSSKNLPIVESSVVLSKSGIEMPDPDHQEQSQSSEDLPPAVSSVVLSKSGIEMPDPDHQEQSQSSEDLPPAVSIVALSEIGFEMSLDTITEDDNKENTVNTTPEAPKCSKPVVKVETSKRMKTCSSNSSTPANTPVRRSLRKMILENSYFGMAGSLMFGNISTGDVSTLSESGLEQGLNAMIEDECCEDLPIVDSSMALSKSGIEIPDRPDPDHQEQSQSSEDLPIVESSVVLSEIGFEMSLDTITEDYNKENTVNTTPEAPKCSKPVVKVETSKRMKTCSSNSSTPTTNTPVRRSLRKMIRENSFYGMAGSLMFGDISTGLFSPTLNTSASSTTPRGKRITRKSANPDHDPEEQFQNSQNPDHDEPQEEQSQDLSNSPANSNHELHEHTQSSQDLLIFESSVALSDSIPEPDHDPQEHSQSPDLLIFGSSMVGGSQGSQGENSLNDLNTTFDIVTKLCDMADEEETKQVHGTQIVKETPTRPSPSISRLGGSAQKHESPTINKRLEALKEKAGHLWTPPKIASAQVSPAQAAHVFKTPTSRPKIATPKRKSFVNIPAKVDSGLRKPPSSIQPSLGLPSPVGEYIYSRPAPSPIQKITGIPTLMKIHSSAGKAAPQQKSGIASTIPRPSLPSLIGSSKYNTQLNDVKSGTKFFKPLQYNAPKATTLDNESFAEKHCKENYVVQRHTGIRSDDADASIVQGAVVPKKFIQSKLATPRSYIK